MTYSPPSLEEPNEPGKLIYLGACLIAGIRLARATQIARTVPVENAIEESLSLARMIFDKAQRSHKDLFHRTKSESG